MIDRNLWDAAQWLVGTTGARPDDGRDDEGGAPQRKVESD
jgi:hypothetical protein